MDRGSSGGGFDFSTGKYTIQEDGIYDFSIYYLRHDKNRLTDTSVHLIVDNKSQCNARSQGILFAHIQSLKFPKPGDPDQSTGVISTCHVVGEYKAGQKVFVKLSAGNILVNAVSSTTGFIGFKIN